MVFRRVWFQLCVFVAQRLQKVGKGKAVVRYFIRLRSEIFVEHSRGSLVGLLEDIAIVDVRATPLSTPKKMKCPHCLESFFAEWTKHEVNWPEDYPAIDPDDSKWCIATTKCPSCRRLVICLQNQWKDNNYVRNQRLIQPKGIARQEPKCFSVGQRLMSSPISPMTVRAVLASILSI
jgi:hypothetical protein